MSGRMSDADIYTLSPTCSFEQEGEGVVVFDAGGGTYWRGNATARRVLELTVHGCTRGDAVERLGVNAGIIAAGVEECDSANGGSLCPTSR